MNKELLENCYEKSIELLMENSSKFGFLASAVSSRAIQRNYLSIFARDASICSLGAISDGRKELLKIAKKSLITLAGFQADNGQIPNYVNAKNKSVNFWKMGCIDSTLWWLIAVDFYNKNTEDKKLKIGLENKIKKAIDWLMCHEHLIGGLLVQTEASDWADIMPRSGLVLYTNSLWLKVKREYGLKEEKKSFHNFNKIFYPYKNSADYIAESHDESTLKILKQKSVKNYYLSYVDYLRWGEDIDVYGNSLGIVFEIINKNFNKKILSEFLKNKKIKNYPIAVLYNPIKKTDKNWRKYMERRNQNYPYKYHNGGIWPFASCFFALALAKAGFKKEAFGELEKIAFINKKNNWGFKEWFNGETGKASGMKKQSWNAGAYILTFNLIMKNKNI
jgi:cellobiose phosphorylase